MSVRGLIDLTDLVPSRRRSHLFTLQMVLTGGSVSTTFPTEG